MSNKSFYTLYDVPITVNYNELVAIQEFAVSLYKLDICDYVIHYRTRSEGTWQILGFHTNARLYRYDN